MIKFLQFLQIDELCLVISFMGKQPFVKLISQTANYITDLHQKMEKELESMEQEVCKGDVQSSTLARYLGRVLDTAEMGIFREIERIKK